MSYQDDLFIDQVMASAKAVVLDMAPQVIFARWTSAEGVDANLSQIKLGDDSVVRFVPKMAHVTGLTANDTVVCVKPPNGVLVIWGKLVGDITLALV